VTSQPLAPVARVVPDVAGLDKQFDYEIPAALRGDLVVGDQVRVMLHGRRVRGWVVTIGQPSTDTPVDRLVPIIERVGRGPAGELVELAEWTAWRWGSDRLRSLLAAASPPRRVSGLGARSDSVAVSGSTIDVVRTGPLRDPLGLVLDAARSGPTIAIHPSVAGARALARRVHRAGHSVAVLPDEWERADGGVDVVVGARGAVWAPCVDLRHIVVLDEHDEALQEERSPTWHARDVAVERARRVGARCTLVSPVPTLSARELPGARLSEPSVAELRAGWPRIDIVDRSGDAPWKRSLVTSELVAALRGDHRVACIHNVPGRARLLACRSCRSLQHCTVCDASVGLDDDRQLTCARCGASRPPVCDRCGSGALANVRPGVTRLREELEAAAGRPVGVVTSSTTELPNVDVYVGTEALLHRITGVDVVAFLDLDAELLAPRYRATEQVLALLARAARLVGGRRQGSSILVQTHEPDHPVLSAIAAADPAILDGVEAERRRGLALPPFAALAAISGEGAQDYAATCGLADPGPAVDVLVRSASWTDLADALRTPRPRGSRLRVEVDPPRR
jgi:primosomal protein N' (replication factor Y) (superfamily II helicase)